MSEENKITVELRDRVGKGAARAARREGLVPGIVYGDKRAPQAVVIERRARLFQSIFNRLECVPALIFDALRHRHGGIVIARRPRNENPAVADDRARIADVALERGTGGDKLA